MKKLLSFTLLAASLTTQITPAQRQQNCSVPCPASCNAIDNITVSVGDKFFIDRPVSGGIGFHWEPTVSQKHQDYIEYLGKSRVPQNQSQKMMGGTQTERFHFKALRPLKPGARAIRFTRWYRGNADETCDVMIRVD